MRTPKQLFLASPSRKPHEDWAMSTHSEFACIMALSVMESEMPESLSGVEKSWDYGAQMIGARRVLDILQRLHEPLEETKRRPLPQLPIPH